MSPFKSEAQRKKFLEMAKKGEISPETYAKWNAETPKGKRLPERIRPKRVRKEQRK